MKLKKLANGFWKYKNWVFRKRNSTWEGGCCYCAGPGAAYESKTKNDMIQHIDFHQHGMSNGLAAHEKLAEAKEEFGKAVMESRFGKFLLWMVDRMSQMINRR